MAKSKTWIGQTYWMNGPCVLSPHSLDKWKSLRKKAKPLLEPFSNAKDMWFTMHEIGGANVLVLGHSTETGWQARPWGGYLIRALQTDSLLDKEYAHAVAWKPDGISADAWKLQEQCEFVVKKPGKLLLVDFATHYEKAEDETLAIDLAPGTYHVDWIGQIAIPRSAKVELLRVRNADADRAEVDADAGGEAAPLQKPWPVTATTKALAKGVKLVEPEFGNLLFMDPADLPKWGGNNDIDGRVDYEQVGSQLRFGKVGKIKALDMDGEEPTGIFAYGKQWLIVRWLGADKASDLVATACGLVDDKQMKWLKTKVTFEVGKKGVWMIDAAANGAKIKKPSKLAQFAKVPAGKYALERADITSGEVIEGKKTRGVMFEVYRLVKK